MYISKNKITISLFFLCFFAQFAFAYDSSNLEEIYIKRADGSKIQFNIEVAKTNNQRETGLMFRNDMPDNHGMLFLFDKEEVISMWMKNTEIPLDIIFIDKDGIIKKIAKNTTPHSLKTISSETSVVAVLEINAMMSDKLSINKGDMVLHSFFRNVAE